MSTEPSATPHFPTWDQTFDSTGSLLFRTARHVPILAALGCLAFVAVGFWLLGRGGLAALAGLLSILCFGLAGIPCCVYLFIKPRSLAFTAEGVQIARRPSIPWSAVAGAGHVTQGPQTHAILELTPEGMAAYEQALTGRAARTHASQKSYVGGNGVFFPPYLSASPRDIAAWVNENRQRLATG
ncbi:hypothetical protein BJH93_03630 [Kocuria polaris]|nr:hypothetical protein [Kocuria polaris]